MNFTIIAFVLQMAVEGEFREHADHSAKDRHRSLPCGIKCDFDIADVLTLDGRSAGVPFGAPVSARPFVPVEIADLWERDFLLRGKQPRLLRSFARSLGDVVPG